MTPVRGSEMMTEVKSIWRTVLPSSILDGQYNGYWSGYTVKFAGYECSTKNGVRGINVPCVVTVKGDSITVTTK